ncbi:MAG: tetratricopeptide repeat protein [Pseudomonadota bacterium]
MPTSGRFRVGSATIDLATRQLHFSDQAKDVQPKVFDLLVYLLVNRQRVVGKDELFDQIWPSVVVSDATLSQTVKRARDLFRNQGFDQDIIRTVSRKGYQFNLEPIHEGNSGETLEHDESHGLVVRATWELHGASPEAEHNAEKLLREALEKSPDHVPALVRLSQVLRRQGTRGKRSRDEAFHESLMLAERAVRLDPGDGLAYLQLAELQHRHFWDFDAAAESFERALQLAPDSAELQGAYSRFLAKSGKHETAVRAARAAAKLDAESSKVWSSLALRLIKVAELDEAESALEALKAIDGEHSDLPWLEANFYLRRGEPRTALRCINREDLDYLRLSLNAIILHQLERVTQAEHALDALRERDADGAAFQIAEVYAQWGDHDQAFHWLDRALHCGDPGLAELYSSLLLEDLYADPRLGEFAGRVGLPPLDASSS